MLVDLGVFFFLEGSTADPRLANPYFGGERTKSARMSKSRLLPDLVAA